MSTMLILAYLHHIAVKSDDWKNLTLKKVLHIDPQNFIQKRPDIHTKFLLYVTTTSTDDHLKTVSKSMVRPGKRAIVYADELSLDGSLLTVECVVAMFPGLGLYHAPEK